jgi:hypothetical protein
MHDRGGTTRIVAGDNARMKSRIALLLVFAGCASQSSTGNADLGVASFELEDTDSRLAVTGLDADGNVVVELRLTEGQVLVEDFAGPTLGRALEVEIHGKRHDQTWAGLDALVLPSPEDAQLDALLRDRQVASHLEQRGISLEPRTALVSEAPYYTEDYCRPGRFVAPCANGGGLYAEASHVNYYYINGTDHEYTQRVVCQNWLRAERRCVGPGATTTCGTAGPQGCAVCWSAPGPANSYVSCEGGYATFGGG